MASRGCGARSRWAGLLGAVCMPVPVSAWHACPMPALAAWLACITLRKHFEYPMHQPEGELLPCKMGIFVAFCLHTVEAGPLH